MTQDLATNSTASILIIPVVVEQEQEQETLELEGEVVERVSLRERLDALDESPKVLAFGVAFGVVAVASCVIMLSSLEGVLI